MRETLAIVLPCFNEEANIASTVSAVRAWMEGEGIGGEIIVVDDGSTDGTEDVLRMLASPLGRGGLRVIRHKENQGYGAAVRSGCDAATAEWIGFMDSDGQFDPGDFDRLLVFSSLPLGGRGRERGSMDSSVPSPSGGGIGRGDQRNFSTPSPVSSPQGRGEYLVVVGRRRKRADPFLRRVNAKLFGILSFLVLGIWVRDANCAMKVFRREVWRRCRPTIATGALFNAEFFYNLKRQGIPWKQVNVSHYPRRGGRQTGAKVGVIVRMFRELLSLRRQRKP